MSQQQRKTNRLILENSPYLLQHAYNPVDWYPWGEAAFARARAEDKPIFLSIGYSTCHWCHVMERETFENEAIARLFNEYVIPVKVDREVRPDIDQLYMTFVQAMTGQGGWPLNVFLTPQLEPFYGATYIPPEPRFGQPGIRELLEAVHTLWTSDRSRAQGYADRLVQQVRSLAEAGDKGPLDVGDEPVLALVRYYQDEFDEEHGGFATRPKFPQPHALRFLLDQYVLSGSGHALEMAEKTLQELYKGGIHDHLGGGYARYSVDERWLVPHFEKMLYDNAGLLEVFALAYRITGRDFYRKAAYDITDYLAEVMTDPSGAFYAAEDADSEGVEGKFYVFGYEVAQSSLGEDADDFLDAYGLTLEGNFEGDNILNLLDCPADRLVEITDRFAAQRRTLKAVRDLRVRPHLDDKILASWNGRMISALAQAGRIFRDPGLVERAVRAAAALKAALWQPGVLAGSVRQGKVGRPGVLDDYAGYCLGFIDLYEATYDPADLAHAEAVFAALEDEFKADGGGYHLGRREEGLLINPVDVQDFASASGNSLVAHILLKLSALTFKEQYARKLEEQFRRFAGGLNEYPQAMAALTDALALWRGPRREFVLAGPVKSDLLTRFREALAARPVTTSVILLGEDTKDFSDHEFLGSLPRDAIRLFQCTGRACGLPVTEADEIARLIREQRTE